MKLTRQVRRVRQTQCQVREEVHSRGSECRRLGVFNGPKKVINLQGKAGRYMKMLYISVGHVWKATVATTARKAEAASLEGEGRTLSMLAGHLARSFCYIAGSQTALDQVR